MRAMKDSGIQTIGKIPTDWKIARLKYVAHPYTGNSIKDEEKGRYEDISEIPYVATKDIDATFQTVDYDNGMYIQPDDLSFKRVPKDSTLLCVEGGSAGKKIAFVDRTVCFVNKLCCFHSDKVCNNKFLYYYLMSPSFATDFTSNISGLIGGVSVNKLATFSIPVPCMDEQQRIADFLDNKCADIDTVISEAKALIEDYKLLKQSIITQAVTKGLDPNAEMKDSGIEWIGEVPKEWKIIKIKKIASLHNGDRGTNYPNAQDLIDDGICFLTSENLNSFELSITKCKYITEEKYNLLGGVKVQKGDIVFCLRGSLGKCSINEIIDRGTVASSLVVIRPETVYPRYLNYVLHTEISFEQIKLDMNGTCAANLSAESISNFYITMPNIDEQCVIAAFLDNKCSEIDALISEKEQMISDLEAYKKSLIFECVTGKMEVA